MNASSKTLNFDVQAQTLEGETISLNQFKGQTLLIVNTASKCGFTPQYEGLQKLYETYKDSGLTVLGFPCNQFLSQEPSDSEGIASFCQTRFGVSFPLFKKIEVNGPNTHPLYEQLKKLAPGFLGSKNIKWNFTKFLVNKEGEVLERFSPNTDPKDIEPKIQAILNK